MTEPRSGAGLRGPLCATLLALAACGTRHPRADLPRLTAAAPETPPGSHALTVTLAADGRILARGQAWSLDGLAGLLRGAATRRETLPGVPFEAAALVARLRVDQAVPWRNVDWVLCVLAENKVWRARFVYARPPPREIDLEWNLPYDLGLCPSGPPTDVLQVAVRLGRARPDDLAARIEEARASRLPVVSEIRAHPGTPWAHVAWAFERLRAAGLQVDFAGDEIPGSDVRARAALPPAPPEPRFAGDVKLRGRRGWFQGDRWHLEGEVEPEIPEEELEHGPR